jgi:hypothetical protein
MIPVAPQPQIMHARRTISTELTQLAALQAGVVTTEQAMALGQSRHSLARLVRSGQWVRLATGLYLTQARGATPLDPRAAPPHIQPRGATPLDPRAAPPHSTVPYVDFDGLAWGGVLLGGDGARLGPQASGFMRPGRPEP